MKQISMSEPKKSKQNKTKIGRHLTFAAITELHLNDSSKSALVMHPRHGSQLVMLVFLI